jgi:hypothetical protein
LSVVGVSPLFESANLFVRRELFERLGGFESWLGPESGKELGEDVWFGWRVRRAGGRVTACAPALVHHEVFPRSASEFVAERWRLRFFPALIRRVPELRRELLYRRLFLNRRAAKFDVALAGFVLAAGTRRPLLAVTAVPYARAVVWDLRGGGSARVALAQVCADAVGLAAMLVGTASRDPTGRWGARAMTAMRSRKSGAQIRSARPRRRVTETSECDSVSE